VAESQPLSEKVIAIVSHTSSKFPRKCQAALHGMGMWQNLLIKLDADSIVLEVRYKKEVAGFMTS
jgi:hypothetical protein